MLAHTANAQGLGHLLEGHLVETARLARGFAQVFGAGELAYYAGLWHDLGKFAPQFQEYLNSPKGRRGPDHKSAGAIQASSMGTDILAWVVAGHHGGLPSLTDLESRLYSMKDTPAVRSALSLAHQALPNLGPDQPLEQGLPAFLSQPPTPGKELKLRAELFTRMLFSALVDADFLDTEQHLHPEKAVLRGATPPLDILQKLLEASQSALSGKKKDNLNIIRHHVYLRCLEAASLPPGIFRLTAPTGVGKTRSAMAFALRHALANGQRRVIVSLPYTSIIEQTAQDYRQIFGGEAVLEHHSEAQWWERWELEEEPSSPQTWARLASENWDAPIVVTTNVQLFESLFAYRPARCRKLHNVASSVIILDEVQTLPPGLLAPTLDVLRELTDHYGVSVVLCSATIPAFEREVGSFALPRSWDIVPNAVDYFRALRRVDYELPQAGENWSWSRVAQVMRGEPSCMVVVNTKKDALALLEALSDPEALHLSTYLCGAHRRRVLEEVRKRLKENRPCRLVTTQVVEAGVDLDFPIVLRAMGPLDRIIQAAGRCNREGRMDQRGRVVVFQPEGGGLPQGAYGAGTQITQGLLRGQNVDLFDPTLYRQYFDRLFPTQELDAKEIQQRREHLDFPEVAKRFRLIEDDTVSAVVPYEPERPRVEKLLAEAREDRGGARRLFRQLQPYIVGIWRREVECLNRMGLLSPVREGLWEWRGTYDPVRGVGVLQVGLDPENLVV